MAGGSWHRGWGVPWVMQPTQWWSLWYDQQGMDFVLLCPGKSWSSLSLAQAACCPLGVFSELGDGQFECWLMSVQTQTIQVCEINILILALWTPSKAWISCPSSNLPQVNKAMKGKVLQFWNCQLCLNSGMSCQDVSHPRPQGWPSPLFIQVGSLPEVCWCVSVITCVPIIRQNCYRDKFQFISVRTRRYCCMSVKKGEIIFTSLRHIRLGMWNVPWLRGVSKQGCGTHQSSCLFHYPPQCTPIWGAGFGKSDAAACENLKLENPRTSLPFEESSSGIQQATFLGERWKSLSCSAVWSVETGGRAGQEAVPAFKHCCSRQLEGIGRSSSSSADSEHADSQHKCFRGRRNKILLWRQFLE